jgi:ubiquinone/menaquinone biosynthesis C-methylase UbiE
MRLNNNFLYNYLAVAPLALAIERSVECEIMSKQQFQRPILDIGCGDGLFAFILFKDDIDIGVDPNGNELRRAKQLGKYKELIQCPGNNIPKKTESVNTIISNSVLEHIPKFKVVLKEANRLLTPNGRLYITVPTDRFDNYSILYQILSLLKLRNFAERYRQFFNAFWKHYNFFNKEDWENIFQNCGFVVVQSREYNPKAICLINNFLSPFAALSYIIKKLFNRWILSTMFRKIYILPFYFIAKILISKLNTNKEGGIIFFSLEKKLPKKEISL